MNRRSWDTTAPRRPSGEQLSRKRRVEDALVSAEADLIRIAWEQPRRISPF